MQLSKQIYKRFLTLVLGLALAIFGGTQILIDLTSPNHMSDQEIINRAKELGLQEMKDVYQKETNTDKTDQETTSTDKKE